MTLGEYDTHLTLNDIRNSRAGIFIACTGAGAGLQRLLWSLPGASQYMLGAEFPYAAAEIERFIGYKPVKFCSKETAIDMAIIAYILAQTALYKQGDKRSAIGLGLTASVATSKEHRGDHRMHVAVISEHGLVTARVDFEKAVGLIARHSDGERADHIALQILRNVIVRSDEPIQGAKWIYQGDDDLLASIKARPLFTAEHRAAFDPSDMTGIGILPGAFNPPHEGHFGMASVAESERPFGVNHVIFSINLDHPSKGTIPLAEALARVAVFRVEENCHFRPGFIEGKRPRPILLTTGQPLYIDKAESGRNMSILIGADALDRMLDPKWGIQPADLCERFINCGARFIVFPRGEIRFDQIVERFDHTGRYSHLFHRMKTGWSTSSTLIREERERKQ